MANAEIDVVRAQLAASPGPTNLPERRARLDAFGARYAVPSDVRVEPVTIGAARAEWTITPGADPARVLLFFHGGSYISGSLDSHRHLVVQAGREAGVRAIALAYRLAPEHPFPAALDDAVAAYHYLLAQGYAPRNIAVSGESAGGGLVLAMLMALRDAGVALPACVWCSSPWVDLTMSGASMGLKAAIDPLISRMYLLQLAADYCGDADPRSGPISPLYGDLRGLPPMLIQVGSAETLLDDAVRLAGAAGLADVRVRLEIWPDMIHAWTLFFPQVDDGRRALAAVGAYIRAMLDAAEARVGQ